MNCKVRVNWTGETSEMVKGYFSRQMLELYYTYVSSWRWQYCDVRLPSLAKVLYHIRLLVRELHASWQDSQTITVLLNILLSITTTIQVVTRL